VRLAIGLARGVQRSKVGALLAIGTTPLEGLRPGDVDDLDRRCGSIGLPVALGRRSASSGSPQRSRGSLGLRRRAA
jgi:hypothetical protein